MEQCPLLDGANRYKDCICLQHLSKKRSAPSKRTADLLCICSSSAATKKKRASRPIRKRGKTSLRGQRTRCESLALLDTLTRTL